MAHVYMRPRLGLNRRARNKIWRIITGDHCLPSGHADDMTYVEVDVRDLPDVLRNIHNNPSIRMHVKDGA